MKKNLLTNSAASAGGETFFRMRIKALNLDCRKILNQFYRRAPQISYFIVCCHKSVKKVKKSSFLLSG